MNECLFIDDEEGQRELIQRLYQMFAKCYHGEVTFTTASTWREGLEIIRSRPIDVLLLDIVLPKDEPPLGREDTLELLRTTPHLPPVVILTGAEDDEFLRDKCILAGADDFLGKREAVHHPEYLCEKCYLSFMRRQRDLRQNEKSA